MDFEAEKQGIGKLLKRHIKASRKYIVKCRNLLEKASTWQKELHFAELLSAHQSLIKKGMREVQVPDWENNNDLATIVLDPSKKPSEEIAYRFRLSRKLRLSQEPLQKQLANAEQTLLHNEAKLLELENIESEESLCQFKEKYNLQLQTPKSKDAPPPLPYHEFFSESHLPIWVGKNAKGNDAMTFKYANGNDVWLHIADYPGSHVIIHAGGKEIDEETLQDALQLAIFYSKGKETGKAEVAVTQKKHVSKLGSAAGKVQLSKQKTIMACVDLERLQRLKLRKK